MGKNSHYMRPRPRPPLPKFFCFWTESKDFFHVQRVTLESATEF